MADSTYTGVISGTVLNAAKDTIGAYSGNYVFFCGSENHYLLVRYVEDEQLTEGLALKNCRITEFEFVPHYEQYNSDYLVSTYNSDQLIFANPDLQLVYASWDGYPHLQEGVTYYGFALVFAVGLWMCYGVFRSVLRAVR